MSFRARIYDFLGTCTSVIDGDTVEVRLDLGFYTTTTIRVRLLDVFAPEIFSGPAEIRATGRQVKSFVQTLLPEGTPVRLVTEKDRRSFNRYVGTVYTLDGDGSEYDVNATIRAHLGQLGGK